MLDIAKPTRFYGARFEYIPVGSTAASLLPTAPQKRVGFAISINHLQVYRMQYRPTEYRRILQIVLRPEIL
jgi:hypothetical protein